MGGGLQVCKGPLSKGLVHPASSFHRDAQKGGGLWHFCNKCSSMNIKQRKSFVTKVPDECEAAKGEAAGKRRCTNVVMSSQ